MASNNKAKNIKGLFTNPKTRVGIVVVGGILLGCVAFGLMRVNSNNNKPLPAQAGANLPAAPVVNTTPGSSNDPNYNALVGQDNAAKIDQAEKSGTSVLPVLTKNTNIDKTDPFDNLNKEIKELNKTIKNKKYFVSNKFDVPSQAAGVKIGASVRVKPRPSKKS